MLKIEELCVNLHEILDLNNSNEAKQVDILPVGSSFDTGVV